MNETEEVGVAVKLLRERAGPTQRQLAERLEVHQPAVARWEAGGVRMPLNRIEQTVGELGYAIEYDLKAVPIGESLHDGVPVRLLSQGARRDDVQADSRRVTSGDYDFRVNEVRWKVDIWDAVTGVRLPGTLALLQAPFRPWLRIQTAFWCETARR